MTITIRRATPQDAAAIARVRVDGWRLAYRGLVPDAYLDAMDVEASIALWQRVLEAGADGTSVYVAERDGEIAGFAAGNMLPEPRHDLDAELSAVYVRREFQHAGIGRRLVASVARAQREHGATGLIVWVIAGNKRARSFFENLGAALVVEQPFEWDGMALVEAGYGFRDLDALVRTTDAIPAPPGPAVH